MFTHLLVPHPSPPPSGLIQTPHHWENLPCPRILYSIISIHPLINHVTLLPQIKQIIIQHPHLDRINFPLRIIPRSLRPEWSFGIVPCSGPEPSSLSSCSPDRLAALGAQTARFHPVFSAPEFRRSCGYARESFGGGFIGDVQVVAEHIPRRVWVWAFWYCGI